MHLFHIEVLTRSRRSNRWLPGPCCNMQGLATPPPPPPPRVTTGASLCCVHRRAGAAGRPCSKQMLAARMMWSVHIAVRGPGRIAKQDS